MTSNSKESLDFDLNYTGLDVKQDETANMIVKHSLATKIKKDNLFIKINGIEY